MDIPGPIGNSGPRRVRSRLRRFFHPFLAVLAELVSRTLDIAVSGALLLGLSPLWAGRALVSRLQAGVVLTKAPRIGRFRAPFDQLGFAGRGPLRGLAVWLNILRGDMAIVGPRPLTPEEGEGVPVRDLARFLVRPGLISPYRLRSQVGIAHQQESELDRELVYGQSLRGDLGLAARSLVAVALGGEASGEAPPVLNFFGILVVSSPVRLTTLARARPSNSLGSGCRSTSSADGSSTNTSSWIIGRPLFTTDPGHRTGPPSIAITREPNPKTDMR